jgi:hypothetical protein
MASGPTPTLAGAHSPAQLMGDQQTDDGKWLYVVPSPLTMESLQSKKKTMESLILIV